MTTSDIKGGLVIVCKLMMDTIQTKASVQGSKHP